MLSDNLMWRYATKHYDTTKKVSDEDIQKIIECGRYAPSSYGFEPWMFYVISSPEVKEKIYNSGYKIAQVKFNQPQYIESSHMVVICAKHKITRRDVKKYLRLIAEERNVSLESLNLFKKSLHMALTLVRLSGLLKNPFALFTEMRSWCERQCYVALGFMLAEAAERKVDSCAHEGFIPGHVGKIIGCKDGYSPMIIMTLGYRDENDISIGWKKVRKDYRDTVIEIK